MSRAEGNNEAKFKEINDKTNLLRLVLSGLAFRLKADVSKQYIQKVREWLAFYLANEKRSYLLGDKALRFVLLALSGISARINLSDEETYKLFLDSFPRTVNWPDAIDLIDELGIFLERSELIQDYDNKPFIREFIDALHDYGKAIVEVGVTCDQFTVSVGAQTEGFKEIFDNIMAGMEDF